MKNPTLTTVLNIIPGIGYVYLGGKKRIFGILLLVAIVLSAIAGMDPSLLTEEYMNADPTIWDAIGLLSVMLVVGSFMYDGYASTLMHNEQASKKKK